MSFTSILVESKTFSVALQGIFLAKKANTPKFSIGTICKRTNIKSRGYLSDVIHGKRNLSKKFIDPVIESLQLPTNQAIYLKLLWIKSCSKNALEVSAAKSDLERLHHELTFQSLALPNGLEPNYFAFKVFASFGLFQHRVTLQQLLSFFGKHKKTDIKNALKYLIKLQLIEQHQDGHYFLTKSVALFATTDNDSSQKQYVKDALEDAKQNVDTWLGRNEESCFYSFVLSVNKEAYQESLGQVKRQFIQDHSKLHTKDGDLLIHCNLQIYPAQSF